MAANENATGTLEGIGQRDHGVTSEYRIYGPPGCGKTTNLTRQIARAVDKYGADSILVTSFSRGAAAELAGRDLPIAHDRIGTLHSHCYHALGGPEIAEANVDEWNRDHPSLAITQVKKQGKLEGEESAEDDDSEDQKTGDDLLQQLGRLRGRMVDQRFWPQAVREFSNLWTRYKRENGLLDFTDLIDTCYRDVYTAPKNPSVIFADEAQDLNKMQLSLIRKWGNRAEYFIVAGDDDQCQPPGTMVRTSEGDVPIELLDPEHHALVSYAAQDGCIYGKWRGFRFTKASREYDYRMLTVRAGELATRCTPEHKFYVRWSKGDRLDRAHVVYLMQRGDRFRVGWCKLIRSDGNFHLGHRARLERAEAAWILRVFYDRTEASIYESFVAAKYGLPLATFEPVNGAEHYSRESLDRLFEMLRGVIPVRAAVCLLDHGRDPRFPIYSPARAAAKRGGKTRFLTEASNMVSEIMAVPVADGGSVRWEPIAISEERYCGLVYSLDVDVHHTYVADGIVTHNCIYSFTGASPEAILDPDIPDDHKIILKQSYRVPRSVHAVADAMIRRVTRRQEKVYLPRPDDGGVERLTRDGYKRPEVDILPDAVKHLEQGKMVMFLASCSYMLRPVVAALRAAGIPFHNPYRKPNGFWNPLRVGRKGSTAGRVLALVSGAPDVEGFRPWTNGDVREWAEVLQAKGILRRGSKKALASYNPEQVATLAPNGMLMQCFEPGALESLAAAWDGGCQALLQWWREGLTADVFQRAQFPVDIAVRRGPRGLTETPQVVVGTIHSVKGGQADVVYLFPDLSQAADEQYARGGQSRDSVIRVFYVGITRARERLIVCKQETPLAVAI